jgi:hypothetical protein
VAEVHRTSGISKKGKINQSKKIGIDEICRLPLRPMAQSGDVGGGVVLRRRSRRWRRRRRVDW